MVLLVSHHVQQRVRLYERGDRVILECDHSTLILTAFLELVVCDDLVLFYLSHVVRVG